MSSNNAGLGHVMKHSIQDLTGIKEHIVKKLDEVTMHIPSNTACEIGSPLLRWTKNTGEKKYCATTPGRFWK